MKMMGETIELHNLSIGYQTKHGVRMVATGINGTIKSGELTCLLGANGVGKSTLLRTLSSFQPKTGGEILLEGKRTLRIQRQAVEPTDRSGAYREARR